MFTLLFIGLYLEWLQTSRAHIIYFSLSPSKSQQKILYHFLYRFRSFSSHLTIGMKFHLPISYVPLWHSYFSYDHSNDKRTTRNDLCDLLNITDRSFYLFGNIIRIFYKMQHIYLKYTTFTSTTCRVFFLILAYRVKS